MKISKETILMCCCILFHTFESSKNQIKLEHKLFCAVPFCTQDLSKITYCKIIQLDGVGPVGNRPSTDELHHFVDVDFLVQGVLLMRKCAKSIEKYMLKNSNH